jgi:membrane-bound serine protease (ClpP class)
MMKIKSLSKLLCAAYCAFSLDNSLIAEPNWMAVDIGIVGAASQDVLESAVRIAEEKAKDGLLIILDTPGGSLESTREMVQLMMTSRIPIAVWVGPDGARAGSAGAFITIAGHFAAMAPGTNIGASHPVQSNGSDVADPHMAKKVENDTVAFIESIAKSRNRNVEVAASFVLNSVSLTADEALKNNIVDLIAPNPTEFLNQIHERKWVSGTEELKLQSQNAQIEEYEYSLRQKFLSIISNPNLFYLFFLAGIIGLGFELTHPGSIFPGVFGAICMAMALIATSVLPISVGAGLLILCGLIFIVAEMFVPSFGALGIGGMIAFVAGSVLLVDPSNAQGLRISLWMILPAALTMAAIGLTIGWLLLKSSRQKLPLGQNNLIGAVATVIKVDPDGSLSTKLNGEIWSAVRSDRDHEIKEGSQVRIIKVEGLKLIVELISE